MSRGSSKANTPGRPPPTTPGTPKVVRQRAADGFRAGGEPTPSTTIVERRALPSGTVHSARSQIVGGEPGPLGNSRQHPRSDFFLLMKRKHIIRPIIARQNPMRGSCLAFDGPTEAQPSGEHQPGFGG
jgi:hypothetical protein